MRWLVGLGIFVLCVFDACITIYAISSDLAVEINPIWIWANLSFRTFFYVKTILAGSLCLLVIYYWDIFKIARTWGIIVVVVYFLLDVYHIVGLIVYGP